MKNDFEIYSASTDSATNRVEATNKLSTSQQSSSSSTSKLPWLSTYPNFYPQSTESLDSEKRNGLDSTASGIALQATELHVEHEGETTIIYERDLPSRDNRNTTHAFHVDVPTTYLSDAVKTLHVEVSDGYQFRVILPAPINEHNMRTIISKYTPLWQSALQVNIGQTIRISTLHGTAQGKLLHFEIPPFIPNVLPLATVVLDEGNSVMSVHNFDISYPPPISFISSNMAMADPSSALHRFHVHVFRGNMNYGTASKGSVKVYFRVPSAGMVPSFDFKYELKVNEAIGVTGREKKKGELYGFLRFPNSTWFDLNNVKLVVTKDLDAEKQENRSCHVYQDAFEEGDGPLQDFANQLQFLQMHQYGTVDDDDDDDDSSKKLPFKNLNVNFNASAVSEVMSLMSAMQSPANPSTSTYVPRDKSAPRGTRGARRTRKAAKHHNNSRERRIERSGRNQNKNTSRTGGKKRTVKSRSSSMALHAPGSIQHGNNSSDDDDDDSDDDDDGDDAYNLGEWMFDKNEIFGVNKKGMYYFEVPYRVSVKKGKSTVLPIFRHSVPVQVIPVLETDIYRRAEKQGEHGPIMCAVEIRMFNPQAYPTGRLSVQFASGNCSYGMLQYSQIGWTKPPGVTRVAVQRAFPSSDSIRCKWKRTRRNKPGFESEWCIKQDMLYRKVRKVIECTFDVRNFDPSPQDCILSFSTFTSRMDANVGSGGTVAMKYTSIYDACRNANDGLRLEINEDKDGFDYGLRSKTVYLKLKGYEQCIVTVSEEVQGDQEGHILEDLDRPKIFEMRSRGLINASVEAMLLDVHREWFNVATLDTETTILIQRISEESRKLSAPTSKARKDRQSSHGSEDQYDDDSVDSDEELETTVRRRKTKLRKLHDLLDRENHELADAKIAYEKATERLNNLYFTSNFNLHRSASRSSIDELEKRMDRVTVAINQTESAQKKLQRRLSMPSIKAAPSNQNE